MAMDTLHGLELTAFSDALAALVKRASSGVVAVRGGAYSTASGVAVRNNLIAVSDATLRREGRVPVRTSDGSEFTSSLLGRDPSLDIAFLRVDDGSLTPLAAADPASLKAGALAAVIGCTMDVGATVSLGILGAVGGSRRAWRGGTTGTLDHFFRLDVNLYPSQAGAAVVNAEGKLIGLATSGLMRHSAVAVPFSNLNRIADELLKEGRIRRGYLGVGLQPVAIQERVRHKLHLEAEGGLMVLSIEPDSPADAAGVQLGDILIALENKPVSDVDELQAALTGEAVGRKVQLQLIRAGELVASELSVAERPRKGK